MEDQFTRTRLLLGNEALDKLKGSRVAVFGVGGVGGYVCEALARSGIGSLDIVDDDKVSISNINRQIIATHKSVGKYKVDVMKERILDINPNAKVNTHKCFFLPENADDFPLEEYDYIIDAIDTVSAKLELIKRAKELEIPIISAMGAGNKIHAQKLRISDISKTNVCPLAKVMRKELKKRGINHLKLVFSDEDPIIPPEDLKELCRQEASDTSQEPTRKTPSRRDVPGSIATVPAVAGLLIAEEVIRDLCGLN